jgi:hypothetical protein
MWRSTLLQPHTSATAIFSDELDAGCLERGLESHNGPLMGLASADFEISDSGDRNKGPSRQFVAGDPQHRPRTKALFSGYHQFQLSSLTKSVIGDYS